MGVSRRLWPAVAEGGTLRLRTKWWMLMAGVREDGGEACGSGIRVSLAPSHGTVPPLDTGIESLLSAESSTFHFSPGSQAWVWCLNLGEQPLLFIDLPSASQQVVGAMSPSNCIHTAVAAPHCPTNHFIETSTAKSSSTAMLTSALWRHTAAGMPLGDIHGLRHR
jgi:hypothetical protein